MSQATTQTQTTPSLRYGVGPNASKARASEGATVTVTKIDRLAGGRANLVRVNVANPKKPGSIADRNWSLYGKLGESTVSVATFLKAYPAADGGLGRARASLAYDINYGYVSIVNAEGESVTD